MDQMPHTFGQVVAYKWTLNISEIKICLNSPLIHGPNGT